MLRRLLSLSLFVSACICAPLNADVSVALAPLVSHYDHRETDEASREINRETGYLRGLELALGDSLGHGWDWRLVGRWQKGRVDYRGQTQSGVPLATHTDIDAWRLGLEAGFQSRAWPTRFSGAVHRYQRQRDIRASARSLSLDEQYQGWELVLDAEHPLLTDRLWLNAGVLYRFDSRLSSDLGEAGYGEARLTLPGGWGGRVGLRWPMFESEAWQAQMDLNYEYRKTARSDSARVTGETGTTLLVTQPESRLEQWVVGFNVHWSPW